MRAGLAALAALVVKDLRIELRTKDVLVVMALFAVMTVVLFHFAFDIGLDEETRRAVSSGMFWLAMAFSGVLGLSRSVALERQNETLRGLLVAPVDRSIIFAGKLLANVIFMFVVAIVTYPVLGTLLDLPWMATFPEVLLVFALGIIGFAGPGTLFAAAGIGARLRDSVLPVILFPIVLPALIAGMEATASLLSGKSLAEIGVWLRILGSFDVIFVVLGVLLFEFTVDE